MHTTSKSDLITWKMVAKKVPKLIPNLGAIIKGLRYSKTTDPTKSCGLGWTFEKAVQKNPGGIAIAYEDVQFSYIEINQWANRIAHFLIASGVRKGDVIALFLENRPELLVCVLAIAKIGGINAMINTSQTGHVLTHSFNLVEPKLCIIGEEMLDSFRAIESELSISKQSLYFLADTDTSKDPGNAPEGYRNLSLDIANNPDYNPETTNQIYNHDPCFYIYTSGTTGLPKAGIFKHGRWMKAYGSFGLISLKLKPGDLLYCTLPLYHATGLCVCWNSAIAGAAGFAIRRKFSASNFWPDVRKYNATAIAYVGELCRYLIEQPARTNDVDNPVKKMIGNGLRPNVWNQFVSRFGIDEVYEFYAASDGNIGFSNVFNFSNTVGYTTDSWALVEYDKETEQAVRKANGFMQEVKQGETGLLLAEIDVKAPLDGYTDPEKTCKVILTDVFRKGDQWFNTGDLLRNIGFGHCQFVDRLGDTYRWKGENVSTTEVENILCQHPDIAEAVVYGVEIPNTNGRAGMACITPAKPDNRLNFAELLAYCKTEMPSYEIPLFLRISQQVETTSTFKYQKSHLKEQGYHPEKTGEPVFAWLPDSDSYSELDYEQANAIDAGKFRY